MRDIIYLLEGQKYQKPLDSFENKLYAIDVSKFDKIWSNNPFYVSLKCGASQSKIKRINRIIKESRAIKTPEIILYKDGSINILDGRHRFAILKQLGKKSILVILSLLSEKKYLGRIGALEII